MEHWVRHTPVHYVEHGKGIPVLVLHGAGVDHRDVLGAVEPVFSESSDHRRIYPDLPGMGQTPAKGLDSADDVLEVLLAFIDGVVGEQPFRLIGHSVGAYYARGIASCRPEQVEGLALICPIGEEVRDVPAHEVMVASVDPGKTLNRDQAREFREYFVVQTKATLQRFKKHVAPSLALVDEEATARIGKNWKLSGVPRNEIKPYPAPAIVLTGRQDSTVGYAGPWQLLQKLPRATFAVIDEAGHALPHENPAVFKALMTDWLDRVREYASARSRPLRHKVRRSAR